MTREVGMTEEAMMETAPFRAGGWASNHATGRDNGTPTVWHNSGNGATEPDCSPHPFDIMAIQALYQTVP